jgi:hypothetical protein
METIQDHITKINKNIKYSLNKNDVYIKSTCISWGVNEHEAVKILAQEYSKNGYKTSSKISYGVTDTYFYPKSENFKIEI